MPATSGRVLRSLCHGCGKPYPLALERGLVLLDVVDGAREQPVALAASRIEEGVGEQLRALDQRITVSLKLRRAARRRAISSRIGSASLLCLLEDAVALLVGRP